jgi:hypothetical protein
VRGEVTRDLLLIRKFETSARNGHPFRDIQGLGGRERRCRELRNGRSSRLRVVRW